MFEMSFGDIMCCQVFFVLWHELGGCLVSQARCLLIYSLWFILCSHRDSIACMLVVLSLITRSHRSTQMRCATSETRMWSSRDAPLLVGIGGTSLVHWGSRERDPQPRIVPMVMLGQGPKAVGQILVVVFQMVVRSGLLHISRMCSRDSVLSPHSAQRAHCSWFLMLVQKLPIFREWWRARYMKLCIGFRMSACQDFSQIVLSVSIVLLVLDMACRAMSRFIRVRLL